LHISCKRSVSVSYYLCVSMEKLKNQHFTLYQSPKVEVIFYNPEASFLAGSIEPGIPGQDDED